jgi:Mg/Co/Ni transporter MgtE
VKARAFAAGWDECVVIDCDGLVAGRLRNKAWKADDQMSVEEVMEPGPSTVRPDGLLEPLVGRMTKRGTHLALVTTPQGELIGALIREEAQRLLRGEPPEQIWRNCDGCPGRWAIKASRVRMVEGPA